MKVRDYVNIAKNKRNNQLSFTIKKLKLKKDDVKIMDILNLKIPLNKKLEDFEKL